MRTILFIWELGSGLGHLLPFQQVCHYLDSDEYKIYIASRNIPLAKEVFEKPNINFIEAPFENINTNQPLNATCYTDLLISDGFNNNQILMERVIKWNEIYSLVKPDIIIFDHSPSALLSALSFSFKKIIIGSGFLCPPSGNPFGDFFEHFPNLNQNPDITFRQNYILNNCNDVLQKISQPPIKYISDLYSQANETFITSFKEFDHFPSREEGNFIGVRHCDSGIIPSWPDTTGMRVFIYLKPFAQLAPLIELLAQSDLSIIFYTGSFNPKFRKDSNHETTQSFKC